jgi:hypothetical protein
MSTVLRRQASTAKPCGQTQAAATPEKSDSMASYSAPPVPAPSFRDIKQVELVFTGVDQAGPSFEARVFLNNPTADDSSPQTPETGYAGSFHVYGYGKLAPPAIAEARLKHIKGAPAVTPIEKRVRADEAAVRAALHVSKELTVTVVLISSDLSVAVPERPFEHVDVVFR